MDQEKLQEELGKAIDDAISIASKKYTAVTEVPFVEALVGALTDNLTLAEMRLEELETDEEEYPPRGTALPSGVIGGLSTLVQESRHGRCFGKDTLGRLRVLPRSGILSLDLRVGEYHGYQMPPVRAKPGGRRPQAVVPVLWPATRPKLLVPNRQHVPPRPRIDTIYSKECGQCRE